jgi:hypothetical protein
VETGCGTGVLVALEMTKVIVGTVVYVDVALGESGRKGVSVGEGSERTASLFCSGETTQDVHEKAISNNIIEQ